MTTAHGIPPSKVGLAPKPDTRLDESPRFMRWLGWLLVSILVLGAGGLIWYGIANDSTATVAGDPPVIANVNPWDNPEVATARQGADAFIWSSPGALTAPALAEIDPHTSPEAFRAPVTPTRIP